MPILSYFTRFTWRGGMPAAGILGWKRSKYYRPIPHISKSPETSREHVSEYIKNIGRKKYQWGATHRPRGWGACPTPWARPLPRGPPGRLPMHIFWYKVSFAMEKIRRKLSGRNTAATRRNQSRAPAELFCRGNFPPGGGNHHHLHHQRSSHREGVNLHQHLHQHHLLSNPSSSLVSNLVSKPQIGTCGLLVVLITPCSWC